MPSIDQKEKVRKVAQKEHPLTIYHALNQRFLTLLELMVNVSYIELELLLKFYICLLTVFYITRPR